MNTTIAFNRIQNVVYCFDASTLIIDLNNVSEKWRVKNKIKTLGAIPRHSREGGNPFSLLIIF